MRTFIRAVTNRGHDHTPAGLHDRPQLTSYTQAWVAVCYGTTVDQPCPEVKIEFPEWAIKRCCDCCVAADERGELDHEVGDHCPYAPCNYHQPYPVEVPS